MLKKQKVKENVIIKSNRLINKIEIIIMIPLTFLFFLKMFRQKKNKIKITGTHLKNKKLKRRL